MANESQVREEEAQEQRPRGGCNRQRVMSTINLMEKGIKQAFLDNELGVEEIKSFLDEVKEAKGACQSGDENACLVLDRLMSRFAKR